MRIFLGIVLSLLAFAARAEVVRGLLQWKGLERSYLLDVPAPLPATPMPLVIALHGAGGDGPSFAGETKLGAAARAAGMLAVFPSGVETPGRGGGWNAHFCCGKAVTDNVDDIGFIGALIDALAAQYKIDRNRLYATGMSNGAMFAYQLAAARPWFAAIAPVSGTIGGVSRSGAGFLIGIPPHPVPVMIVHGRKDPLVLYDGGSSPSLNFPNHWKMGVPDAVSFWVAADGCADTAESSEADGGKLKRVTYPACRDGSEVVLWEIAEGGHEWPSGVAFPAPGGGTRTAAAEIVAFFARHALK